MTDLCTKRLMEERKSWISDDPYGFVARPVKNANGTLDLKHWNCLIPGVKGTSWEGGYYKLDMKFTNNYPCEPPICKFTPPIFHPNVYPSGDICLSILQVGVHWKPSMTIKKVLLGIQAMLENPNINVWDNKIAYELCKSNRKAYEEKIKEQAKKYDRSTLDG